MGKEDWMTIRLPYLLVEAVDKFVETDLAKKNGIFSRSDFVTRVLVQWFSQYEKEFDMFVGREIKRNIKGDDITKPFD
jgi:metal-responsive CopG/Arc/MetJ family transcriptional regulator